MSTATAAIVGLKAFEVKIRAAGETVMCTDCGEPIITGWPYAIRREVKVVLGTFQMSEKIQCFKLCKGTDMCSKSTPFDALVKTKPEEGYPAHPWSGFVQNPSEPVMVNVVPSWLGGLVIAKGYSRIVRRVANGYVSWFVEVPEALICKDTMQIGETNQAYTTWKTNNTEGDSLQCRQYLCDYSGDEREGCFYINCKVCTTV